MRITGMLLMVGLALAGCDGPSAVDAGGADAGAADAANADGGNADAGNDAASSRDAALVDARADSGSDAFASPDDTGVDGGPDAGSTLVDDAGSDAGSRDDGGPIDRRDVIRPRVTVNQGATQADPTHAAPIVFDVTFDEPIDATTLDASDFIVDPALPVTRAVVDTGDHRHFQLTLSGLADADESYDASLPDSTCTDRAGNPNEPSTSTDARVYYDVVLPTVEVRKYPPVISATNTLPITFQVVFQVTVNPATFTPASILNGGTATGVVWQIMALNPGLTYLVSATAVGTPGTLYPVIPAATVMDVPMGRPNLTSTYLGDPVTYSTEPILAIADAQANEGDTATFILSFVGTATNSAVTTFDWTTIDGTAIAGADYVAASGTDVTIAAGVRQTVLHVSALPEDTIPEPHRRFQVRISNVRGGVLVSRDTATGTVVNDDDGYYSFGGGTSGNTAAAPWDLRLYGDHLYAYGDANDYGAEVERRSRATGALEASLGLSIDSSTAAGLAVNALGYYVARNESGEGYVLDELDLGTQNEDSAFGMFGAVTVTEATGETLLATDVAADASHVFVAGQRVDAAGNSAWFVECRDGTTGALVTTFGASGTLAVDHAAGTVDEAPSTMRIDGTNLYVLGHVGGASRIEQRTVATGALVTTFGAGGTLDLSASFASAADFDVASGSLYVIGIGTTTARVARFDSATAATSWSWDDVMDEPHAITVSATGLYLGGGRGGAMHMERWMIDGTPIWARTFGYDKMPAAITSIAYEPSSSWVHAVGYLEVSGHRNWYYDRRYVPDGFTYTNAPTAPQD